MKTKITLLFTLLFIGLINIGYAQQDEECMTKLSIFHEYVKAKNYDAAYEPWMAVRNKCPKFNNAIYIDGEKILDHKIEKSSGADKINYINDLLKLWEERALHFASKTKKGEYAAKACQLMYDNRKVLNKTEEELYECFDVAYKLDKATFTNPKSLYTYFSLMVDLYDAKKKPAKDLFNKYDDVVEKVEEEVKNYSEKLNRLIEKEDAGTELTKKEDRYKKYYESYLKAYDQISGSIDQKLGDRANCENLIPLYKKDFEENKNNAVWLQRAAGKMSEKECTDDPLFFQLVNAYHELSPSANSAYYLGILKDKEGKSSEAIKFYEQAIGLETDNFKKAKLYNRIALKLKARHNYGKARNYFRQALKLNPSNGRPYLSIAAMYAASANNCGDTNFNKRAVYWLAADEARNAARVDPTQKKNSAKSVANYLAKAPQKSEIFSSGRSGEVIKIGCWIGASVTVPKI
ncbi:tetratricopeptide repeat protein [Flavivirga sp. 57AJ16]|uniref:tetratricopeptide repeat protein n=1 Tax=Flavivirga sp. 57AJ16 TaxID=3025307 RepID=UPI002365EE1F|nr:tetratricopeptide repeat protein [Flavivirga sp. 57AJ16]MDD7886541.1 tetratricopeptide repeat protein [Flavivirga sp. 57AJ16]